MLMVYNLLKSLNATLVSSFVEGHGVLI